MEKHLSQPVVNYCQCPSCLREVYHPDQELHRQMNLFLSRLDEQQRRWYAALESKRIGHGGDRLVASITGISEKTIRRGRRELAAALDGRPVGRVRRRRGRHIRKRQNPKHSAMQPKTAG
jgi:hypothetical protein